MINPQYTGSMFDYYHNNVPKGFNPDYIPYAKDVSTITTHYCYLAGIYELPQEDRIAPRRVIYERLTALGRPSKADVMKAQEYIYNL